MITEIAYYENNHKLRVEECPKADSIILVYDITKREAFKESITYYNYLIHNCSKENVKVILIGNKSDLEGVRQISYEEASKFASSNNYYYIETSCFKNKNVLQAFEKIIVETYKEKKKQKEKRNKKAETNNIKLLIKNSKDKKKKGCI